MAAYLTVKDGQKFAVAASDKPTVVEIREMPGDGRRYRVIVDGVAWILKPAIDETPTTNQ